MRTFSKIALSLLALAAAVAASISLAAPSLMVHNPGWQTVELGCYFMALGYIFVAGCFAREAWKA